MTTEYVSLEERMHQTPLVNLNSNTNSLFESYLATVGADNVNAQYAKLFQKLDSFEAPYLEERCLEKGICETSEQFQELFGEFKKYLALGKINGQSMNMFSEKVDEVWHQFILFTKEYTQFGNDIFGGYVHHSPSTSAERTNKKEGIKQEWEKFFSNYESVFGGMVPTWLGNDQGGKCNKNCRVCSYRCFKRCL